MDRKRPWGPAEVVKSRMKHHSQFTVHTEGARDGLSRMKQRNQMVKMGLFHLLL